MKAQRKPEWLKVPPPWGRQFSNINGILKNLELETVCKNANCPNIGECFSSGTATFLIMGSVCTRNCRFCNIEGGVPKPLDPDEPKRVAEAVKKMNLSYAVITSVTRDDIPNGGASHFAETINQIRKLSPDCRIEVLVPDFQGISSLIETVVRAKPDVFNHNIETVPSLYKKMRPNADYQRSLNVLKTVKELDLNMPTKSGMMVGAGETIEELLQVFSDLNTAGISILTIGQYLPPSAEHYQLDRYYTPEEFNLLRSEAENAGIKKVVSLPLARSSYHAKDSQIEAINP